MLNNPVDEAKILKPRPATDDDNSWPIFTLKDVDIFSTEHKKRRLNDLWKADPAFPLVVEGTLDKLPRRMWKYSLSNSDPSYTRIRVPSCTHWAYGQYDDGEVAFWAAGRSGWFEIKPSRVYSSSYKSTRQAIEYLYFVADFYRAYAFKTGSKAGQLKRPLASLFADYAAKPAHKCPDEETARLRLYSHREMLLGLMSKSLESSGWAWPKTEVFKFLSLEESVSPESSSEDHTQEMTPRASLSSSDDSDLSRSNPRRLAGKGKSTLRPKSGKSASKARSRIRAEDGGEEMMDKNDSPTTKRRKTSHMSSLESLGHNLVAIEGEEEGAPVRRRRGRPPKNPPRPAPQPIELEDSDEEEDGGVEEEEEEEEVDPEALIDAKLPLRLRSGRVRAPEASAKEEKIKPPTGPLTTLSLSSTRLPDIGPNTSGMADTFTCPFDGCTHRVYKASSEKSKDLIREHYSLHADQREKRMELVMAEERPYLPVSNLMRKIREMAAVESTDPKGMAALGGEIIAAESVNNGVKKRY